MGIFQFDEWVSSANVRERSHFKTLKNAQIAIEADHYLSRLMSSPPTKEPLLSAIGGLPFALRHTVHSHLKMLQEEGIKPFFVFCGLDGYRQDDVLEDAEKNKEIHQTAWNMYEHQQPQEAVNTFGKSGAVKPGHVARFLQTILREANVPFMVAPYSAWAQLAWLETRSNGMFDAISGASECFLFGANAVITEWDFTTKEISWTRRRDLVNSLGGLHPDLLTDALLLSGSALLPTLPAAQVQRKQPVIKAIRDMLTLGNQPRNGHQLCQQYQDEPQMKRSNYLDRYRKARTAVRNHCVVTTDAKLDMLNPESAPGDIHEIMGQRLPDELCTYLGKGLIGPRLLNRRMYDTILELPALAGGDHEPYRKLTTTDLMGTRQATYGLLSHSLHRAFQYHDLTVKCWFAPDTTYPLKIQEFGQAERDNVFKIFVNASSHADITRSFTNRGLLGITTLALNDDAFANKSVGARDGGSPLVHKDDVLFNTLWRVMYLRGYIDASHKLTPWGSVLVAAISSLEGTDARMEESVFLAVELARLGLLNADNMFPNYTGVPYRGSDTDKRNTILVSRVACLFQLGHESIGFTGPLSRGLLAYNGIICSVREALRDLTEAVIATMFLNGDVDRNRNDITDMGLDLPFLHNNDCGLGIAVVSYLDELVARPDPKAEDTKKEVRNKGPSEWFPHGTDFRGDLDKAFKLWDAVVAGLKAGGSLAKERKLFEEVDSWLAPLR